MPQKIKTYLQEILKKDKNIKLITIVGISLIALIFIFSIFEPNKKDIPITTDTITMDEYILQMENKVSDIISSIEGVGKSKVMITLDNALETVYESENKSKTSTKEGVDGKNDTNIDNEENLVLIEGDNGRKQALIKTQLPPKIKGIAVVCEGGDNPEVINQIISTMKAIFDLNATKINVAKITNQ